MENRSLGFAFELRLRDSKAEAIAHRLKPCELRLKCLLSERVRDSTRPRQNEETKISRKDIRDPVAQPCNYLKSISRPARR